MTWDASLELAKKDQETFIKRGEKIVKRFRDDRGAEGSSSSADKKYNILWSNVRTMFPAIYSRKPKAQVERRYKDADPVGRAASQILERALQYEIDHYPDYDSALRGCILDRLLPGRGVAWVRFEGGSQITDDVSDEEGEKDEGAETLEAVVIAPADPFSPADPMAPPPVPAMPGAPAMVPGMPAEPLPAMDGMPVPGPELLGLLGMEPPKKLEPGEYECTPCDYVFWKDFRHSPARTWEEVTWVARLVYMSKDEVIKRFGKDFADVPLNHEPIGLDKDSPGADDLKKAKVWEIWDKSTKKAIWRCEGYDKDLDSRDDPLELEGFFPCPKPLYATMTTDTLIPIADYVEYQDQADELDELTMRISLLTKAVKAVGVYDASQPAIARLMQEGTDNTLIPVDNWAAFGSAGGLKGAVDMLPMTDVVNALNELYKAREVCKQVIYEVTGLSDIIRGASMASETATAQQIKSQYASLRLKETTQDVARFATDLLNMKAQIMASLYRRETLIEMSGIAQTEDAKFADKAIDLIKSESMRSYRIEIATDSMVELDEQAEKASRVEFLTAAGGFLEKAIKAVQVAPEMAPLMGEMLMFGVRAFKGGRPIEAAFEQAVQKLNQPQQPKPDPEAAKAQAAQAQAEQDAKLTLQVEQIRGQADMAIERYRTDSQKSLEAFRAQLAEAADARAAALEERLATMASQLEIMKDMRSASTQLAVASIKAGTAITPEQDMAADQAAVSPGRLPPGMQG